MTFGPQPPLSWVHFIGGKAAKKQANEVSHFTALPPIRKPMNGPLPKQASGYPHPGSSSHQVSHTTPTKKQDSPLEQQTVLTTPVFVFRLSLHVCWLTDCFSLSLLFLKCPLQSRVYNANMLCLLITSPSRLCSVGGNRSVQRKPSSHGEEHKDSAQKESSQSAEVCPSGLSANRWTTLLSCSTQLSVVVCAELLRCYGLRRQDFFFSLFFSFKLRRWWILPQT